MNCSEFPWLDYLEQRLPAVEQQRAEMHLEHCAACAAERRSWELLIAEGACVGPRSRLGCPDPETLVTALLPGAAEELRQHLHTCPACRQELDAVRTAEEGVAAPPVPLPQAVAAAVSEGAAAAPAETGLAQEILDLVRRRLGNAPAALERWRQSVAALVADPVPCGALAALEAAPQNDDSAPVELMIHTEGLDVEVKFSGPWMRSRALRHGAPVAGVTIRLENVLGEIAETETDSRGEAAIREDLPGLRRIVIAAAPSAGREA